MLDTRGGTWLVLGGLLLLHLVLMSVPPLNGDEAFYWEWSRHLALAYPTHPPLTAWAIALVTRPLGATELTVRLISLLWHAGTLALVWRMATDLGGGAAFARRAVLLAALLPVLFLLGTLITTDSALIFLWTATAYLAKRAIVNGERRAWYLAGLTAGGMLLTKFFAALFVPGALLFLLAHRRYRREVLRPEPYAGLAIALLLFAPVVHWNAANDWLTFRFNLVARHRNEGFDPFKIAYFLVGQVVAASPVAGALLVAALRRYLPGALSSRAVPEQERLRRDGLRFYAYLVAVPLLIYLAQSPFIHVGAHWSAVVYPAGALLVTVWLHEMSGDWNPAQVRHPAMWAWSLAGAAAVIAPLAALMLAPTWVVPARLRYLDPQTPVQHLVTHYFGWKEAGARIAALRNEWASRPEGFFLSTRDYSIASMLNFYTPERADFVLVGYKETEFHGKEFLLWAQGRKPKGASTIYVSDTSLPPGKPHPLVPFFERVEPLEPLVVRDGRGILRIFYFTAGHGYRANERDALKE